MKKIIKLNESGINKLVNRVLREMDDDMMSDPTHNKRSDRYMFFSNLEQMRRQCDMLLDMDQDTIESILENGHDWAQDHIAEAKNNMDQVFDFLMNEIKREGNDDMMMEGKKKTGTPLCARGKSAAKAKFDVYPSAYANGYAVQVCKGRMPGLDGKKRCSGAYC